MIKYLWPLVFLLISCSKITQILDSRFDDTIDSKLDSDKVSLIFSNNINGETHPCGCRQHPLGGLSQVAGAIHEFSSEGPHIYVDTGDTFFPTPKFPEGVKNSLEYTAIKIAEAMDMLKLKYFVPGDQDFAAGINFLTKISKDYNFNFLISNATKSNPLSYIPSANMQFAGKNYVFLGLVSRSLISEEYKPYFNSPEETLKMIIPELKKKHKNLKVILLSHLSIKEDKKIAQLFPEVSIIIGSHDQAFLQKLETENNAVIAQTLSRNHYLGKLTIKANSKDKYEYKLHEMRDEVAAKKPQNEFINWLVDYKKKLLEIQTKENMLGAADMDDHKLRTSLSCKSCHEDQFKFWQGTAHSMAFKTLVHDKAHENPSCVACHSLGFKSKKGFFNTSQIIHSDKKLDSKVYLADLYKNLDFKESVRDISSKKRKEHSDKWLKLDTKHGVTHNFANVQCMHCHDPALNHPLDIADDKPETDYAAKCMKCHTQDQSPEWYRKNDKGIADKPNLEYFAKKIKEIGCPI